MPALSIKFQFNVESEIERVLQTLKSSAWLIENNYRFLLPIEIKGVKNISEQAIIKAVETEYDPTNYQIAAEAILKSWKGNCEQVKRINQKMVDSYPLDKIIVRLTKYGTQGSYQLPNSMIVNISNIPPEFLIKTVIHESLHLMIENLIKKYAVTHWVKERIVDLIMDLEYQSRFKMQPLPDWTLAVDLVFKENYPNLIPIMEKAARLSPN
ncbi:MAG: hypothetical protein WDZ85_01050 [Candidatus Paceibacterota bacterium]